VSTNIRPSEWKDLRDTTLSERLMLIVRVIIQLKLIKNILRQFLLFFIIICFAIVAMQGKSKACCINI